MNLRVWPGAWRVLLLSAALVCAQAQSAQDSASKRKLLSHEAPPYPALARNMALEGVVKADVLVSPDGTVKSVSVLGGHPVLAQAAANTIRHWRWEASSRETHELVQVRFSRPE